MVEQITLSAAIKNSGYILAFVSASHWLGVRPETLFILFLLMSIDIVTGIIRVYSNEGKTRITSNEFERGVRAKFLTIAAFFALALTTKGVGFDFEEVSAGFAGMIMLSQLYSILGNAHSAMTGKKKSEFDAIEFILDKVKQYIDKLTK